MRCASAFLYACRWAVGVWALAWLAGFLDRLQDLAGHQLCAVCYATGQTMGLANPWAEALYRTRLLVRERLDRLEREKGQPGPILDSWSRQTFPNVLQTIRYHLAKHGQGIGLYRYTELALRFFLANFTRARLKADRTGRESWNIRGEPGGWYTQAGQIITFWIPARTG